MKALRPLTSIVAQLDLQPQQLTLVWMLQSSRSGQYIGGLIPQWILKPYRSSLPSAADNSSMQGSLPRLPADHSLQSSHAHLSRSLSAPMPPCHAHLSRPWSGLQATGRSATVECQLLKLQLTFQLLIFVLTVL